MSENLFIDTTSPVGGSHVANKFNGSQDVSMLENHWHVVLTIASILDPHTYLLRRQSAAMSGERIAKHLSERTLTAAGNYATTHAMPYV